MPEQIKWNVLLVEDENETCRQIKEHYDTWSYEGNRLLITDVTDFTIALEELNKQRYDLLILDVFMGANKTIESGEKAGIEVLNKVKQRRFIPVVFYTALPAAVKTLENPLIKVAEKTGMAFETLDSSIIELLNTGLLKINREFTRHVDGTLREYLWDFVPQNWKEITSSGDLESLAYLLCRRLAASFDTRGAERLAQSLKSEQVTQATEQENETEKVHPMQYYIIPPSGEWLSTGDIVKENGTEEPDSYWLILTPTCDFIERAKSERRAEHVLIVQCLPLREFSEYQECHKEKPHSSSKTRRLNDLIGTPYRTPEGRQEGRFYFLPGALDVPDLIVDFQQSCTVSFDSVSHYVKIATLDSPFRESLVFFFTRYIGRIGTPDLDIEIVKSRLLSTNKDK